MDIVQAIDFDPPTPKEPRYPMLSSGIEKRININRQFDLYMTDSNTSFPAEAPPMYQDDRMSNSPAKNVSHQVLPDPDLFKATRSSKIILKMLENVSSPNTTEIETDEIQQSGATEQYLPTSNIKESLTQSTLPESPHAVASVASAPPPKQEVKILCEV